MIQSHCEIDVCVCVCVCVCVREREREKERDFWYFEMIINYVYIVLHFDPDTTHSKIILHSNFQK